MRVTSACVQDRLHALYDKLMTSGQEMPDTSSYMHWSGSSGELRGPGQATGRAKPFAFHISNLLGVSQTRITCWQVKHASRMVSQPASSGSPGHVDTCLVLAWLHGHQLCGAMSKGCMPCPAPVEVAWPRAPICSPLAEWQHGQRRLHSHCFQC